MDINILERYLKEQMKEGTLYLQNDPRLEDTLTKLFIALRVQTFQIAECRLERIGQRLRVRGKAALKNLASGHAGQTVLDFQMDVSGKLEYQFRVEYQETFPFEQCFGPVPSSYLQKGSLLQKIESPLAAFSVSYLCVSTSSQARTLSMPFSIECRFCVSTNEFWNVFPQWGHAAVWAQGSLSLRPMKNGGLPVHLKIPVAGTRFSQPELGRIFQESALTLEADNGVDSPLPGASVLEKITVMWVTAELDLPGCDKPVEVTADLLGGGNQWRFGASFPRGLTVTDLGHMVLTLMGLEKRVVLSVPQGLGLNQFGLFNLQFVFGDHPLRLIRLDIVAKTTQPLKLPLSCLSIDHIYINWSALWADAERQKMFYNILLQGHLRLTLPGGTVLMFSGKAALPQMEFEAVLQTFEMQVQAADLLGDAAAKLPFQAGVLKELTLHYAHQRRKLSVSAELHDVAEFYIGTVKIALEQVLFYAMLSEQQTSFSLNSTFCLLGGTANAFYISMEAFYGEGSWWFRGWLSSGRLNIAALLAGFLGIQWGDSRSALALTELDLSYQTGNGQFQLTTAFSDNWDLAFGQVSVRTGGRLLLRMLEGTTQASVLLSLGVGVFEAAVQVDDFFNETTRRFLFQLRVGQQALRAVYEKAQRDNLLHEIVSVELRNTTLGSLVTLLVGMINPNRSCQLSEPWNLLNKIDLSRFRLEMDLTDETVLFTYRLNLSIPGLVHLTQIGLRYQGGRLFFVICGKNAEKEETYSWDALDGAPPDLAQQETTSFHLWYLGLAHHYSTPKLEEAETIEDGLAAMEESFPDSPQEAAPLFDGDSGWTLGVDLEVNRMLHLRLLFHDPTIYGAVLEVSADEPPLNFFKGLSLTLLYRKLAGGLGLFQTTFLLPKHLRQFQFGPFGVTIGTVSLSVYTNGDFLLDLGYPYGGDFSRSFTLLLGKYQVRGGFYFGILSEASCAVLPETTQGRFSKTLALGVGISVEFGERYDFGLVKGGLTLTVAGLFEGYFAIFYPHEGENTFFYYAEAMVEFTGRLFLSVDLKILVVNASLSISARANAFLRACMPVELELALALDMQASIRILFFKINFSFHFSTTFRCSLGSRTPAPWEDGTLLAEVRPLARPTLPMPQKGSEPLTLVVTPVFSRMEETQCPCVAFIPMLEKSEFLRFCGALADWLVTVLPESVFPGDARQMTDQWVDENFSYEDICSFFRQKMPICLTIATLESENLEQEAYAFPMPPAVALNFAADGQEGDPICYWEENLVDDAYADLISQYFAVLDPDPTHLVQNHAGRVGEKTPLAQLVFVDYIHMLLRDLAGAIKNAFGGIALSVEKLSLAQTLCGVTAAELLAENTSLTFCETSLFLRGIPYILPVGATLGTLAQYCGCTVEKLAECCGEQLHLLHQGAEFSLAGSFDNTKIQKSTLFCAAYCFVRRHEFMPGAEYAATAQDLAEENPNLSGGLGWEEVSGGTKLSLRGQEWIALPGDTLERLAKTLVLEAVQPGRYPRWDAFADKVCRMNGMARTDIPEKLILPEECLQVDGDATLSALVRRLSPQMPEELPKEIRNAAIFEPLRQAILDMEYSLAEGQTLAALLETIQAPVENVVQAVAEHPECLHRNGVITVHNPKWIHCSLLKTVLEQRFPDTGAMVSRFLLQGLRLPLPEANDGGTVPYYQLLRQQLEFEQNTDWILSLSPQEGCGWIQGAPQVRYMAERMKEELPDAAFQWTAFVQSGGFMAGFAPVARCYTPASTIRLTGGDGNVAELIHLLSPAALSDLPAMTRGVDALIDGRRIEAQPCLLVPFHVHQVDGQTADELWVDGVETTQRDLLAALVAAPQTVQLRLCAAASPTQTTGVLSVLDMNQQETVLVRVNLSMETHRTPVTRVDSDRQDTARLNQILFVQMLWECSVVGGGYRLHLSDPLGEDTFDERGAATLWLLATYGTESPLSICSAANGLRTPLVGQGGPFGNGSIAFTACNGIELGLFDLRPVFPAGCYGAELCLSQVGEEQTLENRTRRLFSILEYQMSGPEYTVSTGDSLPVLPEMDAGQEAYRPVLPLSQLADPQDRYGMLGREAAIRFFCRDLLGNRAPGYWDLPKLLPYYNDVLIGLHQWPGCTLGYSIGHTGETPYLHLVIQFHNLPEEECPAAAAMLELSLAQLARPDVRWEISASVMESTIVLSRAIKTSVLKWGAFLLKILRRGLRESVDPFQITWSLQKLVLPEDEPVRLWAKVQFVRTEHCPPQAAEHPKLNQTEGELSPLIQAEESNCEKFAAKLEEAIPTVKLARQGEESTEFYLVPIGEKGLIRSLTIAPQVEYQGGAMAPVYWSICPLRNHYMEGETATAALKPDGTLEETTSARILTQVDLDAWADDFTADFEQVLTKYAGRGGASTPVTVEALLKTKELLATRIAGQILPVDGALAETDHQPREILQDRLRRTLGLSQQMASIASYSMRLVAARPIRLTIDLKAETSEDACGLAVCPGKLDSTKNSFCIIYQSAGRGRNGFSPKFSFSIRELEYDIETRTSGYEQSKWLVFVLPILRDASFVSVNLDSALTVPNPLRRCPGTPVLTKHSAIFDGTPPLDRWKCTLHCEAEMYEQDRFHFEINFSGGSARTRIKQEGLFGALAQYRTVRDDLMKALEEEASGVFNNAMETFSFLAGKVAAAWQAEPLTWSSRAAKNSCIVDAVPDFSGQAGFRLQTSWKDVSVCFPEGASPSLGESAEFILTVPDLSVYQYQTARSTVSVYRNNDLLRLRDGTLIETNPAFLFTSETVEIQSMSTSAQYTQPLSAVRIAGDISRQTLEEGLKVLEAYLGLRTVSTPLKVSVAVGYRYQVSGMDEKTAVVLPVTFLPPTLYDSKMFASQLAGMLWEWYQAKPPVCQRPEFSFGVTVSNEKGEVLLSCNELWVDFVEKNR